MADPLSVVASLVGLTGPVLERVDDETGKIAGPPSDNLLAQDAGVIDDILGLRVFHSPVDNEPQLDIVFVHGLEGDPVKTWQSGNTCWPKDILPLDFPNARVLSFGYRSLFSSSFADAVRLSHYPPTFEAVGRLLYSQLSRCREVIEIGLSPPPIIFVAHSLGGLIVKSAFIAADLSLQDSILPATKGVCFFGTPHADFSTESWYRAMELQERFLASQTGKVWRNIKGPFRKWLYDENVIGISRQFKRIVASHQIAIESFYETIPSPTSNGDVIVVSKAQAVLRMLDEKVVSLNKDHLGLVRIEKNDDLGYQEFSAFVRRTVLEHDKPKTVLETQQILRPTFPTSHSKTSMAISSTIEQERSFLTWLRTNWLEEDAISKPLSRTCSWIWENDKFQEWKLSDHKSLTICAEPGRGKTVMAKYLCYRLRGSSASLSRINSELTKFDRNKSEAGTDRLKERHSIIIPYFFDARVGARRTFSSMLRCVLYHLLSLDREFFKFVYPKPDLFTKREFKSEQIADVILAAAREQDRQKIVLVFDAVDEVCPEDSNTLANFIRELLDVRKLKILMTSRRSFVKTDFEISFPPAGKSFEFFIVSELDMLSKRRVFPEDLRQEAVNVLAAQSDFLTIQIVLRILARKKTISSQREVLDDVARRTHIKMGNDIQDIVGSRHVSSSGVATREDQFTLEDAIWSFLSSFQETERATLVRCLYFVMEAKSPPSILGLAFLVANQRLESEVCLTTILEDTPLDFEADIKRYEPLLQVQEDHVTLLHGSIKDVLLTGRYMREFTQYVLADLSNTPKDLFPAYQNIREARLRGDDAFRQLTQFLIHSIFAEKCTRYLIASFTERLDPLSFAQYSTVNWMLHLRQGRDALGDQHFVLAVTLLENTSRAWEETKKRARWADIWAKMLNTVFNKNGGEDLFSSWKRSFDSWDEMKRIRKWPKYNGIMSRLAALNLCDIFGRHVSRPLASYEQTDDHPLNIAAANKSLESLRWLMVEMQEHLKEMNWSSESSPLFSAIQFGQYESLVMMLQRLKQLGCAPRLPAYLHKAASNRGLGDIFQFLWRPSSVATGSTSQQSIWSESDTFISIETAEDALDALESAVKLSFPDVVAKILCKQDKETMLYGVNKRCLLHEAVKTNSVAMTERLLKLGADINAPDRVQIRPIHIAAQDGTQEMFKTLFNKGADLVATNKEGKTPLHIACEYGHTGISVFILDHIHADVNAEDVEGNLPLHLAVGSGRLSLVKLLLEKGKGTSVNHFNSNRCTPLQVAACKGFERIVDVLLTSGADIQCFDNKGRTPLFAAVESGNMAVVSRLLLAGASVSVEDFSGQTPLHLAATLSSDLIVRELGRFGADPNASDDDGRTPLDYWNQDTTYSKRSLTVKNALIEIGGRSHREETESLATLNFNHSSVEDTAL